jgi:hypothetical protein
MVLSTAFPEPTHVDVRTRSPGYRRGLLVVLLVLLLASAFPDLRIPILGLEVHAYLIVVVAALFVLPPVRALPLGLVVGVVAFNALVLAWIPLDPTGLQWALRIGAFFATAWVMAHLVVTEDDARLAIAGVVVVTALMGARAFFGDWDRGAPNALEGIANKNGFSLYALPAILAGTLALLRLRYGVVSRLVIAAAVIELAVLTVSSANRSGWVGLVLIALISLASISTLRSALVFILIAAATVVMVPTGLYEGMIRPRFQQTLRPEQSNQLRIELATDALAIGVANPLTGIGPRALGRELATRERIATSYSTHNVTGFVAGAYGLVGLVALAAATFSAWRWASSRFAHAPVAATLVRNSLLLIAVRGQFTEQVLGSPVFAVVIGLGLGWCAARPTAADSLPAVSGNGHSEGTEIPGSSRYPVAQDQ